MPVPRPTRRQGLLLKSSRHVPELARRLARGNLLVERQPREDDMSKLLPVECHVEFYCEGEGDKPVMAYSGQGTFMGFSQGHMLETKNWPGCEQLGRLEVTGVEHILWELKDSHVSHKIMVDTRRHPRR